MINDKREIRAYGVNNVIGDTHSAYVPTAINRTVLEYQQLQKLFRDRDLKGLKAAEIGCGYGRMLPLLSEFFEEVHGYELDDELRGIARELNPKCKIFDYKDFEYSTEKYDLILTYTFLQHVPEPQFDHVITMIYLRLVKAGYLVSVEEFYQPSDYEPLKLEHFEQRVIEATNPRKFAGAVMVFKSGE